MYSQTSYRGVPVQTQGHSPQPSPQHAPYGYASQSGPPSQRYTYGAGPPPPPEVNGSHYDIRGVGSTRSSRPPPSVSLGPNPGFDRDRDGYRDGAWGYRGRFLGSESMGTAEPQPDKVGPVVDSMIEYYKNTEVQPRRYLIRIRRQILELEELENGNYLNYDIGLFQIIVLFPPPPRIPLTLFSASS